MATELPDIDLDFEFLRNSITSSCTGYSQWPASGYIYAVSGTCIIAMNGITIVAFLRSPNLRSDANLYVMSLSLINLLVGCSILCLGGVILFTRSTDVLVSQTVIQMVTVINGFLIFLTDMHMFHIALDRYLYVAHPYFHQRHMNQKFLKTVLAIFWVFSLTFLAIALIIQQVKPVKLDKKHCGAWNMILNPITFAGLVVFKIIVLVSVLGCYCGVVCIANRYRHFGKKNTVHDVMSDHQHNTAPVNLTKAAVTSVRLFFFIFCCFFVCSSIGIFTSTLKGWGYSIPPVLFTLLNLVWLINTVMNVVIFAAMDKDFFKAVKKMFLKDFKETVMCARYRLNTGSNVEFGDAKLNTPVWMCNVDQA